MVIGIIAILAMMAMPSLTEKIVRDQIVEAAKLADIAKPLVTIAWVRSRPLRMPIDNATADLPPADKIVSNFISSITVENGALHLQFGNNAHGALKGKILTLRPAVVEDTPLVPPAWVCAGGKVPDKMVIKGNDKTNIDKRFLPRNCG